MGDEGGFAPSINSTTEGLDLIVAAISARPAPPVHGAHHAWCSNAFFWTDKGPELIVAAIGAPRGSLRGTHLWACLHAQQRSNRRPGSNESAVMIIQGHEAFSEVSCRC